MGVDLPADFSGDIHQQARQLSQSDITDDHKIDIAAGLFLLSGERPKYEGDPDVCFVAKGIYDNICKSACLEDEGADFGVKGMRSVCPIVNTIPVSHPGDDIETLEFLQFRLHGADGKTGSSLDLSHVERRVGRNAEEIAKDLRSDF